MNDKKDENIPNNRETDDDVDYAQGMHPNSLKALKKNQFPKGVSGNAMGRAMKFDHMAKALNGIGDELAKPYYNDGKEDKTKRRVVLEKCWDRAMRGEIAYVKMLAFLGCLDTKD